MRLFHGLARVTSLHKCSMTAVNTPYESVAVLKLDDLRAALYIVPWMKVAMALASWAVASSLAKASY